MAVSARLAKRMRASASGDEVSRLERGLLPLRQKLHLGDVVGMLVADEDDGLDRWFQTQYALAPATVVRVRVRECARGSAPTACAKGATHLLVLGKTIDEAAALGASFGFDPAIVSTGGDPSGEEPQVSGVAGALVALALPTVAAWAILGAVFGACRPSVVAVAGRVAAAALVGVGLSSIVPFAYLMSGGALDRSYVAFDAALFVVLGGGAALLARRSRAPEETAGSAEHRPLVLVAVVVVAVALVVSAVAFARASRVMPHGGWDAWAIWNLRARFLLRAGAGWRSAFSPDLLWSQIGYPLLLPLSVARTWAYGGESTFAPAAVAAVFTFSAPVALGAAVARAAGIEAGATAALVLLGTVQLVALGATQYADVAVAAYLVAALGALLEARGFGGRRARPPGGAGGAAARARSVDEERGDRGRALRDRRARRADLARSRHTRPEGPRRACARRRAARGRVDRVPRRGRARDRAGARHPGARRGRPRQASRSRPLAAGPLGPVRELSGARAPRPRRGGRARGRARRAPSRAREVRAARRRRAAPRRGRARVSRDPAGPEVAPR